MDEGYLNLRGKRVVVTGGTRGIGKQVAMKAQEGGADVWITYSSNVHRAIELKLQEGSGVVRDHFHLDLRDIRSVNRLLGFLGDDLSEGIDYFVANAGVEFSGGLEKHDPERISGVIQTNLVGNLCLVRGLIERGLMSHGGQISVIGSIAADGNHDQFAYSASKAGLRGAVESLRYDSQVKMQGLGVKLLEPAFVRTDMTERILNVLERKVIRKKGGDELVETFRNSGLVMDADYAAGEILRLTVDPLAVGVRTIPEGVNLHAVREEYF